MSQSQRTRPWDTSGAYFQLRRPLVQPCLETPDDRVRRYLALLDLLAAAEGLAPLAAEPEDSESLYVRLDVAYDALSGQEMERVERILRGEEQRP